MGRCQNIKVISDETGQHSLLFKCREEAKHTGFHNYWVEKTESIGGYQILWDQDEPEEYQGDDSE